MRWNQWENTKIKKEIAHFYNLLKRIRLSLAVIAISLTLGAVIAVNRGQDLNWDLLNYHYYNPFAFIHDRLAYDFAPGYIQTYLNPLLDVGSYYLINHFSPIVVGAILGAIQGLNSWLVFEIARLVLRKRFSGTQSKVLACIAALFSFFGVASLAEIGGTMGDNLTSIGVLGSLFLVLLSSETFKKNPKKSRMFRLMGFLLIGMVIGLKLTSVAYALPLLLVAISFGNGPREKIINSFQHGVCLIGGVGLLSGYWYAKLWQMFHSPIFPFYNGVFKSPYYPQENFSDTFFLPDDILQTLFYPFYFIGKNHFVVENEFRDIRFAVCYALLIVVIGFIIILRMRGSAWPKPLRDKTIQIFCSFFLLSYIVWQEQFSIFRYLIALEFLSGILIIFLVALVIKRYRYVLGLSLAILLCISLYAVPMNYGRIAWKEKYFDVQLPTNIASTDSTVLMLGTAPTSFMIPNFPQSTRFVKLEGDVIATVQAQEKLKNILASAKKDKRPIQAMGALYEKDRNIAILEKYGYSFGQCGEISTNTSKYLYTGYVFYELCNLDYLNQ